MYISKNFIYLKDNSNKSFKTISEESNVGIPVLFRLYKNQSTRISFESVNRIAIYYNLSIDDFANVDLSALI